MVRSLAPQGPIGTKEGGLQAGLACPSSLGREKTWPGRVSATGRRAHEFVCQGLFLSWTLSPFPGPSLYSESHCSGHLQGMAV